MRDIPNGSEVSTVLRAAYDVEQPQEQWLRGVIHTLEATLGYGAGVEGLLYDISGQGLEVRACDGLALPATWQGAGLEMHQSSDLAPALVSTYRSHLCGTSSELIKGEAFERFRNRAYVQHGVAAQILINGSDPGGKGCCFYLQSHKPLSMSEALRDLLSGLAGHLSKAYRLQRQLQSAQAAPLELSPREQEVVALAAAGLTNKVIAVELGLAFSTVRVLMARACSKLGVTSRSQLVGCASPSLLA